MNLHPGVEAYLRQILFIGLRQHRVNYLNARRCVYDYRVVEDFTAHFQALFGHAWNTFIQPNAKLALLWNLFNDQTKPIRNRVFHGMRDYHDDMFQLCYSIDLGLIEEIGTQLVSHYQHDFLPPLKSLGLPRVGKQGVAPNQILNSLRSGKSPRYSDSAAEIQQLRTNLTGITIY